MDRVKVSFFSCCWPLSLSLSPLDNWGPCRSKSDLNKLSVRSKEKPREPIKNSKTIPKHNFNIIRVSLITLAFVFTTNSSAQLYVKSHQRQQQQVAMSVPNFSSQMLFGSPSAPTAPQSLSSSQWRSQPTSPIGGGNYDKNNNNQEPLEARGALSRNLYYRGARNATTVNGSGSPLGSWHFPRISPEQAAEVLLTGAQVINRIAQADTPLNYCRTPDNQEGECSDIRKCIWLVLDKARLKQSVCLRNLIIPAVCCPLSNTNNTPIANMIQSTLEPVLFRPKAPKQKKQSIGSTPMRPFASIVNKTVVGSPPPGPAALVIRNPHLNNSTSSSSAPVASVSVSSAAGASTTAATTLATAAATTTTTLVTSAPTSSSGTIEATASKPLTESTSVSLSSSSAGANTLFQDAHDSHMTHNIQHGHANSQYNRVISQKFPWANETCGESGRTRTSRIVGGSDSKLGQWPWMTAMYLNKRSSFTSGAGEFWCGGALINRRFILTAAHCLSDQRGNRYKNDQVTIKLGGVDLVRHQAPLDILRNIGELESRSSSSGGGSPIELTPATHTMRQGGRREHHHHHQQQQQQRATSSAKRNNHFVYNGTQSRSDADEEEEFSWTAFITKALGLGGGSSSSSSASSSSSSSGDGTTKSINPDKKQQLAAHAKKTYFKEYKVANIKQHPEFRRHGFYNDIGLIELKSDVEYDDLISPICLPTEYDLKRDISGYVATVLGWGTLSYGGQGSKLLQQVSMPIWNNKDCDDRYLQHIGKTFLCAGFLTGGKDACQGDSGGPLMVSDNSGRWTLHGVVSFGKTCAQAGYPGVYTRVTEYLDWIKDNTDLSGYANDGSRKL